MVVSPLGWSIICFLSRGVMCGDTPVIEDNPLS